MTTITDVARRASVSAATVSRVLNARAGVSPELADRVQLAVAELGYRPSGPARALRLRSARLWAVMVADVENPFFTSVVRGVEDGARRHGYRMVLCNTDEDPGIEAAYVDVALAERFGGVVVAVASTAHSDLGPLLAHDIPVVAIDRRPSGSQCDVVVVDNKLGARQATEHLVSEGFSRIACVTGPRRVSTANERLAGYREALLAAGLPVTEHLIVRANFRTSGGYEAVEALWRRRVQPDALVVANNQMTLGALEAFDHLGVKIPQDVGIVGFDDPPWTALVRPRLTTVAQPAHQIGQIAADLLATAQRAPGWEPREVVLTPNLVVRESSVR